jgi:3-(3-hydroxy-phenyl)propionate hydroxylase
MRCTETDVAVVGYGPTGATAANLLGAAGVRTLVLERETAPHGEPRAVATDDEVLRIWQAVGLAEPVVHEAIVNPLMRYVAGCGRVLLEAEPDRRVSPHGLPSLVLFHQPALERTLRQGVARFPSVTERLGHEVVGLTGDSRGVTLRVCERSAGAVGSVRARYVLACDGGSSKLRALLETGFKGVTFAQRWVVADLRLPAPRTQRAVLTFGCDRRRPWVSVPLPDKRHRWEFMLHEGEDDGGWRSPERVERLLRSQAAPVAAEVERIAVYSFHSRIADRWRQGQAFLLGDAAHLMPPFAGQGMGAGIRDAGNLCWKLAAVLRAGVAEDLLDTYEIERRPHLERMMRLAVQLGTVVQTPSAGRAVARDALLYGLRHAPVAGPWLRRLGPRPQPMIRRGALAGGHRRLGRREGTVWPQPWVLVPGVGRARLDDLLGPGFAAIGHGCDPRTGLDVEVRALLDQVGARYVRVSAPGSAPGAAADGLHEAVDDDGRLGAWFARARGSVAVVRPDRFVFHVTTQTPERC